MDLKTPLAIGIMFIPDEDLALKDLGIDIPEKMDQDVRIVTFYSVEAVLPYEYAGRFVAAIACNNSEFMTNQSVEVVNNLIKQCI